MMSNLSLAAEVMYISVSPGFWMIYPMILEQGLQMTSTVAYIDSLAMTPARSCRLGFLGTASVDGCYLYIIIHNCILHVTWL